MKKSFFTITSMKTCEEMCYIDAVRVDNDVYAHQLLPYVENAEKLTGGVIRYENAVIEFVVFEELLTPTC